MERKQRIEIADLLEEAVENAIARRNEGLHSEGALSSLSDEDMANVAGGISKPNIVIAGFRPPIIVGLIAVDPELLA